MKEEKFVNKIYENAISDPSVDPLDQDELEASMRGQAVQLCLDPDRVVALAAKRFPQVTTNDFKKASELPENRSKYI